MQAAQAPATVSPLVRRLFASCLALLILLISPATLGAQATQKVLYAFSGGADGGQPYAGVVLDAAGNLYGTTEVGGAFGQGTVFQLTPSQSGWTFNLVYTFTGGSDGSTPSGGVVLDGAGNLYGTTLYGGDASCGCGTVFEISPAQGGWTFQVLHTFTIGKDGQFPVAGVVFNGSSLVGTTALGGKGYGTVFGLSVPGGSIRLFPFSGKNGDQPLGGVTTDLYGTTTNGGKFGLGNVFHIRGGKIHVLHVFNSTAKFGHYPLAGLTYNGGNWYGTTSGGSTHGHGAVFALTPNCCNFDVWNAKLVHAFTGDDGAFPSAAVVFDAAGNMYGTTLSGGGVNNSGTVYKVSLVNGQWIETMLYSFTGGSDGSEPDSSLVLDGAGNLYGTTLFGGTSDNGVVFQVTQ